LVRGAADLKVSTAVRASEFIERIDAFCDAVPRRRAAADEFGPLVLFVSTGPGWPYYARPRRGPRPPVTAADIRAVRARQRELIIPESFEWIEQVAPEMAAAASEAGLGVQTHPLMVLSAPPSTGPSAGPPAGPPSLPPGVTVRTVAPSDAELDRIWAVPAVAFGHPGTATGEAGIGERDKIAADYDGGSIELLRERLRSGQSVLAAAFGPDGPLAAGSYQAVDGVAEITGVGVLPSCRRQGLGAAVTALLARDALDRDVATVFLSASDDAVARVYARIGFREIGVAMIAEPADR
jgi:ribosomal protein S18 acetylase RimI-like enzyme